MGHHGKHIIDPETGLCEICDKDAIDEIRQGKRPGKQVYYSNHGDRYNNRPRNDEDSYDRYGYETNDEPTPRFIRRPVHHAPTVRPRRVVYEQPTEEPMIVRRKIIRHPNEPPDEISARRPPPPPRSKQFYYVDREGQILPQSETPPPEPPRRYVVQSRQLPPRRTVRLARRRVRTPSPNETIRHEPRRQVNSDTEIIDREQRIRREDSFYSPTPPLINPEMYHIESLPLDDRNSSLESPTEMSSDNNTPPPRVVHRDDRNGKQRFLEPIERRNRVEPEPNVVRRVYKKLPPGKSTPPDDTNISNENLPRTIRRNDRNRPPPRQYVSSPQIIKPNNRSPVSNRNPPINRIRPVDEY